MMISCLVIDDEPIARRGLVEHIRQIDFLNLAGECKSVTETTQILYEKKIDLIFLDIQMPKITGIEFVRTMQSLPLTIFTTAYPEFAIEGYELDVLDYLLKPISFKRFLKAALKAQEFLNAKNKPGPEIQQEFFFVKSAQKIEKVLIDEMLFAEALSNYVIIHTTRKKIIVYITFKGLEEQLPRSLFIRIHKSYIVAINAIHTIEGNEIMLGERSLPISKTYKEEVMNRIDRLFLKNRGSEKNE